MAFRCFARKSTDGSRRTADRAVSTMLLYTHSALKSQVASSTGEEDDEVKSADEPPSQEEARDMVLTSSIDRSMDIPVHG